MKKILAIVLMVLFSASLMAANLTGIGAPMSMTATEVGQLYKDTSSKTLWKSNSLVKGDWSKVPEVVENGSTAAPFGTLNVTSLVATGAQVLTIQLVPQDAAPTEFATGTMYLASPSQVLKIMVNTTAETWTDLY